MYPYGLRRPPLRVSLCSKITTQICFPTHSEEEALDCSSPLAVTGEIFYTFTILGNLQIHFPQNLILRRKETLPLVLFRKCIEITSHASQRNMLLRENITWEEHHSRSRKVLLKDGLEW